MRSLKLCVDVLFDVAGLFLGLMLGTLFMYAAVSWVVVILAVLSGWALVVGLLSVGLVVVWVVVYAASRLFDGCALRRYILDRVNLRA